MSKVVSDNDLDDSTAISSVAQLVYPLSNAVSSDIRRRLAGFSFFVRSAYRDNEEQGHGHVVLALEENGTPLDKITIYR